MYARTEHALKEHVSEIWVYIMHTCLRNRNGKQEQLLTYRLLISSVCLFLQLALLLCVMGLSCFLQGLSVEYTKKISFLYNILQTYDKMELCVALCMDKMFRNVLYYALIQPLTLRVSLDPNVDGIISF